MKKMIVAGLAASALLAGAAEAEAHYNVTWKPGAEVHMGIQTCADIQFVPHTDYTAFDIEAWNLDHRKGGFSCRVARRVVRKVILGRSGVGHWHCRHRRHSQGLTHGDFRCHDGHRLVVWGQG